MEECKEALMEMMENEAGTDDDMEEVKEEEEEEVDDDDQNSDKDDVNEECAADKEKYCDATFDMRGNKHTLCAYCGVDAVKCKSVYDRVIEDQEDRQKLVDLHNRYRRHVAKGLEKRGGGQPVAVNMNELIWDEDLARVAQRWADQCIDGHDRSRLIDGHKAFPYVGQNVAYVITSSSAPHDGGGRNYEKMVASWYNEVADFPKSKVSSFDLKSPSGRPIGHYTALVWAETSKVGCGYIRRSTTGSPATAVKETLVCNYAAGGNIIDRPVYQTGTKAGSSCQFGHNDGLCRNE